MYSSVIPCGPCLPRITPFAACVSAPFVCLSVSLCHSQPFHETVKQQVHWMWHMQLCDGQAEQTGRRCASSSSTLPWKLLLCVWWRIDLSRPGLCEPCFCRFECFLDPRCLSPVCPDIPEGQTLVFDHVNFFPIRRAFRLSFSAFLFIVLYIFCSTFPNTLYSLLSSGDSWRWCKMYCTTIVRDVHRFPMTFTDELQVCLCIELKYRGLKKTRRHANQP